MRKQKLQVYIACLISLACYHVLAYDIPRHETLPLFTAYGILFLIYLWVINKSTDHEITFWLVVSFAFRIVLIFSLPQLSDDFYRFIWDGRLWVAGEHPFAALPEHFLKLGIPGIDQELYNHLNSKEYFTIYPPVSQYVFGAAVKISPHSMLGSVIVMRMFILLAELGTLFLMVKLVKDFNLATKNVLYYALNPLIILELTGNLHFEAIVIFFLLLTGFFLSRKAVTSSAMSIGMAICTKLVPLIFLQTFLARLNTKNLILFFITVAATCLLLFFPFFDEQVFYSLQRSVTLYFNKFEFNASFYYLVREYGYTMYGYNIIQTVGWKLGLTTFLIIMIFVWVRYRQSKREQDPNNHHRVFQDWMWILLIYFLFTTTLHPWYITTLLALSVFTPYRFPVVWTGLIFLTYAGYTSNAFHEVLWLTALEYILMIGYLIYEVWMRRSSLVFSLKGNSR